MANDDGSIMSLSEISQALSEAERHMDSGLLAEIGKRVLVRGPGYRIDAILSGWDGTRLGLRDQDHGYLVWVDSGLVLRTGEPRPIDDIDDADDGAGAKAKEGAEG